LNLLVITAVWPLKVAKTATKQSPPLHKHSPGGCTSICPQWTAKGRVGILFHHAR